MKYGYQDRRDILLNTIQTILAEHPELAGEASQAITMGLQQALCKRDAELADTKMALSVSLSLLPPNRVTPESRKLFEHMIVKAFPEAAHQSRAERDFAERIKELEQ